MSVHVLGRGKIFPTVHAQEGSIALVCLLVLLILIKATELFLTLRTAPHFFLVQFHMTHEMAECHVAFLARYAKMDSTEVDNY